MRNIYVSKIIHYFDFSKIRYEFECDYAVKFRLRKQLRFLCYILLIS